MLLDLNCLSEENYNRYNRVKNLTKAELSKISARWALTENINKVYGVTYTPNYHHVVWVNTFEIIKNADFKELNPNFLITGDVNDMRFVKIIEHWEANKYLDPPVVRFDGKVYCFTDGRHRTIAAFQIGETQLPLALEPGSILPPCYVRINQ